MISTLANKSWLMISGITVAAFKAEDVSFTSPSDGVNLILCN